MYNTLFILSYEGRCRVAKNIQAQFHTPLALHHIILIYHVHVACTGCCTSLVLRTGGETMHLFINWVVSVVNLMPCQLERCSLFSKGKELLQLSDHLCKLEYLTLGTFFSGKSENSFQSCSRLQFQS